MFTLLLSALTIATAGGDGLPVKTPRSVGMSAARLAKIDHVIMRGIQAGGYPGAAVVVGRKGALVWERGFGGVRAALHEPAWLWIGGVMSVFIVFAITVGPPRIGVTATVATVIAGNLVSAAIIVIAAVALVVRQEPATAPAPEEAVAARDAASGRTRVTEV